MWFLNKTTKEFFSGDPSENPWNVADCICYDKSEKPSEELVNTLPCYIIIDSDKVRAATTQEREQIDREIKLQTLDQLKQEKIAILNDTFAKQEAIGLNINGIQLAYSEYDQRRLATFLVGINEGLQLGVLSLDSKIPVTQADNTDIELTVSAFKQLSVQYMFACLQARTEHRNKVAAINATTTPEELDAIL